MNILVDTLEYPNDLIDHKVVTRDALTSKFTQLEARLKVDLAQHETRIERRMDMQMLQIRSLQMGGAIAAFSLGAILMLSRPIK